MERDHIRVLGSSPFSGRDVPPADGGTRCSLDEVRLLAPCRPSKIVAVGLNYRHHALEFKQALPQEPLIFLKPSTAVIGPEQAIVLPRGCRRVDYEGELGVVIGRRASRVPEQAAMRCVLGYTCVNDVTERTLQKVDGQWTRAKSFDTFAPVGPWIETDIDPGHLHLETRLNGMVKQRGNTGDLIFGVARLVSFISGVMTLLPGDVISTGTPEGVGPLAPGDAVEVAIEGIGTLRNQVVSTKG